MSDHRSGPFFHDRSAFVTGAGSGIGAATAVAFARHGASVACVDLSSDAVDETVRGIRDSGGRAIPIIADLSESAAVRAAVERTVDAFGSLDHAVNCAGISVETELLADTDDEVFDRVIAVNLRSVFLSLKYEIRQMLGQGSGGSIVNVGSISSFRAARAGYGASKHGVVGLTRSAAVQYASRGIRVNALCPGNVATPMVEAAMANHGLDETELARQLSANGRFGTPEELADAALWLCSDASSYVVGHALAVDGGFLAMGRAPGPSTPG